MARVYISYAIDDTAQHNLLLGLRENICSPIDFTGFLVKLPWLSTWKRHCHERIKSCAGIIGIITTSTPKADGQLWELKCALEEGLPLLLIHGCGAPERKLKKLPKEINGEHITNWDNTNIVKFLNELARQHDEKITCHQK